MNTENIFYNIIMTDAQKEELTNLINNLSVVPGTKAIFIPTESLTQNGLQYVLPDESLMITAAVTEDYAHMLYELLDNFSSKHFLVSPAVGKDMDAIVREEESLTSGELLCYEF